MTDNANADHGDTPAALRLDDQLGPGDWLALDYGFERRVFYVLRVDKGGAWLGHPKWLVSSATFIPQERMAHATRIGRGKARWWWRFVPWRELCLPFSKPSCLFWA